MRQTNPRFDYRTIEVKDMAFVDLGDYSLDELCQMNKRVMGQISVAYHTGEDEKAGYYTLIGERLLTEIKNRVLTTSI